MATKVIRIKRESVATRKHNRVATKIRTEGFVKSLETLKPIHINMNRGVSL